MLGSELPTWLIQGQFDGSEQTWKLPSEFIGSDPDCAGELNPESSVQSWKEENQTYTC